MNQNLIIVATWEEARLLGARQVGGVLVDPETGDRYASVAAGPHVIEGMRIGRARWTEKALLARNARRLDSMITRSQAKSCGGQA